MITAGLMLACEAIPHMDHSIDSTAGTIQFLRLRLEASKIIGMAMNKKCSVFKNRRFTIDGRKFTIRT
jgi:hypothetical protein